jgi:endonuclease/exonuclease/phosphatase family metal-dependent hydrolase
MISRTLFIFWLVLLSVYAVSQNPNGEFSILFYNVENLFDIKDDPDIQDEEFTPEGDRRWTYSRFIKKINNISKVILSASGWTPPDIVALCEVENNYVIERLLKDTPLKSYPFKIIHKESPDTRGIDIALFYNEKAFYPLTYRYFPLISGNDSVLNTREILYVSGIANGADTLHLFVNHWPSRYSGLLESQSLRNLAAKTLRQLIENIRIKNPVAKIVVTGDFNDQPTDESLSLFLGSSKLPDDMAETESQTLYNLSYSWIGKEPGTLKYQSQWQVFDQVIVSGTLLDSSQKIYTRPGWAKIIQSPFLLEKDPTHGGIKPARTYHGFRYNGGFSDHLPVMLKIQTKP